MSIDRPEVTITKIISLLTALKMELKYSEYQKQLRAGKLDDVLMRPKRSRNEIRQLREEIAVERARGTSVKELAKRYGITCSHIYTLEKQRRERAGRLESADGPSREQSQGPVKKSLKKVRSVPLTP